MKKQDFSLFITILRGVAALFGIIAFFIIFGEQVKGVGSSYFMTDDILCGTYGFNATPFPLIGYILIALGALGSIAMIFAKKAFGLETKVVKILDLVLGGALILGGVLVVLTVCWMALANSSKADIIMDFTLRGGPIVVCVFASIAGLANIGGYFLEDRA